MKEEITMALTKQQVSELVTKYGKNDKDTGSPDVQVSLLTLHINELTGHLKVHKNDNHSRRGLLVLVGKRRRLLDYIKATDESRYAKLIEALNIRK